MSPSLAWVEGRPPQSGPTLRETSPDPGDGPRGPGSERRVNPSCRSSHGAFPRARRARALIRIVLLICAAALAASCGYRLSGRNRFLPHDLRRIAIPVFQNETRRADIEQRITENLLDEFIKRGGYATQPQREGADAILEGTVTGYSSSPVTLSRTGKAERLEVVVQARVRLTDLRDGRVLWSQEHFIFRSQYEIDPTAGTFLDREIDAIDRISKDFAETIVTSLLEGF